MKEVVTADGNDLYDPLIDRAGFMSDILSLD